MGAGALKDCNYGNRLLYILTSGHVVDDGVNVDSNPNVVTFIHHLFELGLRTAPTPIKTVAHGLVALPPRIAICCYVFRGRGNLHACVAIGAKETVGVEMGLD